ncbi:transposase [Saccharopolyspora shandongensis]|uniref:transposase n=1 Tax=Saccharopolyspora shandongensis TaxID=418495 RepID=UPI00344128FA
MSSAPSNTSNAGPRPISRGIGPPPGRNEGLTRHLDRKVHLIVDGHPVHRRKTVQRWITKHAEAIEMHFLPGYSPELNPDEILNADLKRTVSTSTAPNTRAELKHAVRFFLHRLQKLPGRVRSYFGKPEVRYAA